MMVLGLGVETEVAVVVLEMCLLAWPSVVVEGASDGHTVVAEIKECQCTQIVS